MKVHDTTDGIVDEQIAVDVRLFSVAESENPEGRRHQHVFDPCLIGNFTVLSRNLGLSAIHSVVFHWNMECWSLRTSFEPVARKIH
jgi:hypothetical protein